MDSLIQMDELGGLVAPDISTDTPEWCENCQVLRQEIKKLQDEQEQSFVKLKQKIISTDLLIKKYKSKCEDYDVQYKKNEESTKRADKFQRQSEILETQLKATLMEAEPLRNVKASMETEIKQKNSEIVELRNRTIVAEGAQRQYEHLTKTSTAEIEKLEAEKRDLTARIKVLEGGKISKETAKELKGEISMLKKENTGLKKNEKRLERRLKSALSKIEELTEKVKEWRTMPAERRWRRGSGTFLSPLRSPSKSPRVSKVSPKSSPKKNSPKVSPKPPARAIAMKPAETEDSDSDNSEDSNEGNDDDDTTSLYRLTFSPLMPCLSPLSPSPACFKQTQRGMSHLAAQHSEEENLSDMADDLEQQLFGDLMDEDSKDNTDIVMDQSNKTKEEDTALNSSDESVEEEELDKTKCENDTVVADELDNGEESGGEFLHQENSSTTTATEHVTEATIEETLKEASSLCDSKSETVKKNEIIVNENSDKNKSKQKSEDEKDKNVFGDSIIDGDNKTDDNKSKSGKIDSAVNIEKTNDNRSVKERLASSIEILSPTATRKARENLKAKTRCKNEITSPTRTQEPQSVSKNISKNISEENKSVPENHKGKEVDTLSSEPLARNDTTEFEPVLTEHDAEKDKHPGVEKLKVLPEDVDIIKNVGHSAAEDSQVVPKIGDESKLTENVSEKVVNMANESDPMSNKEIKCVDSDHNKTVNDSECEIQVDIIEETEPVGALHKTPPSRAYLTRQQCVNTNKHDKNVDFRDMVTSHKSKGDATESPKSSKRSTHKSPKSSPGVFEEDLNLFQDTEAYTVLQRETPQRSNADSRKLRSITKALRNSFKFKDRDSIDSTVHHREQRNITSAFIKHDSRTVNDQKGGKVCDKEVDNASKQSDSIKPRKPPSSSSVSGNTPRTELGPQKVEISDSDSNNKTTCQGTNVEKVNETSKTYYEKSLKSTVQSLSSQSKVAEDDKENKESCGKKPLESSVRESDESIKNEKTTDINISGQNLKSDSESVDAQKSAEENTALPPDKVDEGKSVISPSRQLSTGFVVNSSLERTPSTDSLTSNVELVSAICDREGTRSPRSRSPMRSRSPLTRQKHVMCDTIAEESELDLGGENDKQQNDKYTDGGGDDKLQSGTSGNMILGIDDLFAHQEDYDHSESVDENSDIPDQSLLFGSKQEGPDNEVGYKNGNDVKNVVKTEYGICNDNSSDINKDIVTANIGKKLSATLDSDVRESSIVDTNKPGCSYHHDESFHSSLDQSSNESENIAVTSTSSLMTSARLLTCTPDNIDNELVTVSHSRSRSSTPSICSIGTATPPLSPLSMSPFDFITPISPLPPSPVRQVDRVSPLSPEIVNEVTDNAQIETEQHASNENEQNVGNVPPGIVTPDKTVLNKVIAHSPIHIPDLISPIKTPKQRPDRKIKDEKGKKGKIKSEKDQNKPITFVSSVPTGVLTVKPKQETQTTNTNSKTGVSAIDRPSNRDINLRKHLALKKSVDISSNSDSVFTRKSGHTVSRPKSRNDSINEPTPVKKTSHEVMKDYSTESVLTIDNASHGNKSETVPSVDETGDAKTIRGNQGGNQCTLENEKDSVNITENNNAENNEKKIKCENSMNEVKDTNRLAKLSHPVNTRQENDHVTKDTHNKNQDNVAAKESVAVTSKGDNKSSISKSLMSNIDLRKRTLKHQQFTRAKMSKVDLPSERKGTVEQQDVIKDIKADGTKIDREHQAPAGPISESISEPIREPISQPVSQRISEVNEDHKPSKPEPDAQPAGYDPLMASKRKTRMAHQPRSHPLVVRKPPVIIEPTYQPKALQPKSSQRKRKSLDSSDKDIAPSKKAKGPMFHQRPKSDKKVDPERQERVRRLENYLKSNEKVETLCKNWGQKLNEESGMCIIEICLECLGRFRRDCLESVHEACLEANHLKLDGDLPLLDNVEKKAVWLLSNIYQDKQMALDAQHILKMLWNAIFTKELTMFMTGKMSVARIFTAICLMEGDIEHVRVLLYQVAMCGYLNHWLFVVPVISVWPEVLRKPLDVETEKPHPTILVYEYLVTRSLLEQETLSSRKVLKILEEMCNWSGCLESPEIVLRQLTTVLYDMNLEEQPNKDRSFEVVQACKLLLKNESWSWCNDYFINRQGLQPAYNRYLCKKGTVASKYVCDVLEITRYIISCHSEHVKQREVNHICKTWILNMMSKEEGDPVVQNCCLETLLEISVFSPSIVTEVHKLLQKHPNHSLYRHLQRLEIVRQAYTARFGLTCEPFAS